MVAGVAKGSVGKWRRRFVERRMDGAAIATGRVIGKCYGRHRATEFRKFLDEIEANVPRDSRFYALSPARRSGRQRRNRQRCQGWKISRPIPSSESVFPLPSVLVQGCTNSG
jgi:hypothetical protein